MRLPPLMEVVVKNVAIRFASRFGAPYSAQHVKKCQKQNLTFSVVDHDLLPVDPRIRQRTNHSLKLQFASKDVPNKSRIILISSLDVQSSRG